MSFSVRTEKNEKSRKRSVWSKCKSVFSVQSILRQVFLRTRKSHRGTPADGRKAQIFHGGWTSIKAPKFVPEMSATKGSPFGRAGADATERAKPSPPRKLGTSPGVRGLWTPGANWKLTLKVIFTHRLTATDSDLADFCVRLPCDRQLKRTSNGIPADFAPSINLKGFCFFL